MVKTTDCGQLAPGEHSLPILLETWGLRVMAYAYQMEVTTAEGVFTDCKVMTAAK